MRTDLTTALCVDVEATCWATKEEQGSQPNEIIEIGVVKMNLKTKQVIQKESIIVKPRFTEVSAFCTELTGWTQEEIDNGLDIELALREFYQKLQPKTDQLWFSYGDYDRHKLSSLTSGGLMSLYAIHSSDNPFDRFKSHLNVKTLFALRKSLNKEVGMAKALQIAGLPLTGRHHNGADDAYNIAQLLFSIL